MLKDKIVSLGGNIKQLVAKIFGGACVIPSISNEYCVGDKNAALALDFLQGQGIRVASHDLGGNECRKIFFHTDTGHVFLKRFPGMHSTAILKQEKKQLERIKRAFKKT
jgi:chemotaxis receptor (MCP) glutamine deamidase CheD